MINSQEVDAARQAVTDAISTLASDERRKTVHAQTLALLSNEGAVKVRDFIEGLEGVELTDDLLTGFFKRSDI